MNKVLNVIENRVSCREYSDKKVSLSKAMMVAEAGKMAPSAINRQICNILILKKKNLVEKLRQLSLDLKGNDGFYGATTMLLVYGPRDDAFTLKDGSCILENMFVAATALSIDSCWINRVDDLLQAPEGKKLRKTLGLTENDLVVGTCILGYRKPGTEIKVKARKEDFIKVI